MEKFPVQRPRRRWIAADKCSQAVLTQAWRRDSRNNAAIAGLCVKYSPGQAARVCREGFLGDYCQYRNPCENNTCKHGGTCETTSLIGKATCRCAPGFRGDECQYSEAHVCFVSQPCLHGGTCHPHGQDTYECACAPGFTGRDCQWIDACTSQPCANGSTCTVSGNKFSCICPPGYTGQKCEIDVNECAASVLCQHGGTCVNVPGSYRCQCKPGFTGHRCESPYVPCSPSPCMNGGTCHQTSDFTFECNCEAEGWLWQCHPRDLMVWVGRENEIFLHHF
uniref:Notch receptor 2 n=1 Tax=Nothoprocta perdicaria TaxID=30464 RepID=A0A8C6Z173_NOTPE